MTTVQSYLSMIQYLHAMSLRGRVVGICDAHRWVALVTYFLLADRAHVPAMYALPLWSTPPDTQDGRVCYVDKLVATRWTPSIRRAIQRMLCQRHPQITHAIWHRPTQQDDRLIVKEIPHVCYV